MNEIGNDIAHAYEDGRKQGAAEEREACKDTFLLFAGGGLR